MRYLSKHWRSLKNIFFKSTLIHIGGVSLRLNPVISVFLSGGYRVSESVNLEEGGSETVLEFDASGWMGRFGLGINF